VINSIKAAKFLKERDIRTVVVYTSIRKSYHVNTLGDSLVLFSVPREELWRCNKFQSVFWKYALMPLDAQH